MNGKSVARQLTILVGVVIVAVGALWWTNRAPAPAPAESSIGPEIHVRVRAVNAADTILSAEVALSAGATVQSALEAAGINADVPVGVQEYPFGSLVVAIGAVKAGPGGDWTYTVNDTMPQLGAHACAVQEGDWIDFHFGKTPRDSI